MIEEVSILATSIIFLLLGIGFIVYWGQKQGFFDFLRPAHAWSLLFLICAGVLTWAAMVWMLHPSSFKVDQKQWAALGFSIGISILWWARYAYSVAETAEEAEEAGG